MRAVVVDRVPRYLLPLRGIFRAGILLPQPFQPLQAFHRSHAAVFAGQRGFLLCMIRVRLLRRFEQAIGSVQASHWASFLQVSKAAAPPSAAR